METETSEETAIRLFNTILANQQSLHDDMLIVLERLTELEDFITKPVDPVEEEDEFYDRVRRLVVESGKCSTSFIQRTLAVGYSRAAYLVDQLEENAVIGPSVNGKPRKILITEEKLDELEIDGPVPTGDSDDLYEAAKLAVIEEGKCSTSYLQRKLRINYNRALFIQGLLVKNGVIETAHGSRPAMIIKNI